MGDDSDTRRLISTEADIHRSDFTILNIHCHQTQQNIPDAANPELPRPQGSEYERAPTMKQLRNSDQELSPDGEDGLGAQLETGRLIPDSILPQLILTQASVSDETQKQIPLKILPHSNNSSPPSSGLPSPWLQPQQQQPPPHQLLGQPGVRRVSPQEMLLGGGGSGWCSPPLIDPGLHYRHRLLNGSPSVFSDAGCSSSAITRNSSLPASKSLNVSTQLYGSLVQSKQCLRDNENPGNHHRGEFSCRRAVIQSSRLPSWLLYSIGKCLGIKTSQNDKPIFGLLLYIITLTASVAYCITSSWYDIADIYSEHTETTAITGSLSIIFRFVWCVFGIYACKLGYRLFSNKKFIESVRLHSKTVLKVNTVTLVSVLMLGFTSMRSYTSYTRFMSTYCANVGLHACICWVAYPSQVVNGAFSMLWHLLVSYMLLSVCRTHTIGIRRFIRELEEDAKHSQFNHKMALEEVDMILDVADCYSKFINDEEEEFFWDEAQSYSEYYGDSVYPPGTTPLHLDDPLNPTSGGYLDQLSPQSGNLCINDGDDHGLGSDDGAMDFTFYQRRKSASDEDTPLPVLDCQTILTSYWKIQYRLRITSGALQRWIASWIVIVILWCVSYVLRWQQLEVSLYEIGEFLMPLLTLPLLLSALAEVNGEGSSVLKNVYPTTDRLLSIRYIADQPLTLNVYGMPLTYSSMTAVAVALAVALTTHYFITAF